MDVGKQQMLPTCRLLIPEHCASWITLTPKITFNPGHSLKASPAFALAPCRHVPDTHSHETSSPSRLHLGDGRPTQEFQLRAMAFTYGTNRKGAALIRARKLNSETSSYNTHDIPRLLEAGRRFFLSLDFWSTSSVGRSWKAKCLLISPKISWCRFRYCLSLSPRWIGNKQIFKSYQYFRHVVVRHSWVQSRKHYEHGTLLHLHFYHFLDWKAVLMWTKLAIWFLTFCYRNKPRHLWHKPFVVTRITCWYTWTHGHMVNNGMVYGCIWYNIGTIDVEMRLSYHLRHYAGVEFRWPKEEPLFSKCQRGEGSIGIISGCEPCRSSTKMV